jgi:hypothetical protein
VVLFLDGEVMVRVIVHRHQISRSIFVGLNEAAHEAAQEDALGWSDVTIEPAGAFIEMRSGRNFLDGAVLRLLPWRSCGNVANLDPKTA